jgi:hypothetical protein
MPKAIEVPHRPLFRGLPLVDLIFLASVSAVCLVAGLMFALR